MKVDSLDIYQDSSFIVYEFFTHGTLLVSAIHVLIYWEIFARGNYVNIGLFNLEILPIFPTII